MTTIFGAAITQSKAVVDPGFWKEADSGIWGQSPHRGPGAEPLVRFRSRVPGQDSGGQGGETPWRWKLCSFWVSKERGKFAFVEEFCKHRKPGINTDSVGSRLHWYTCHNVTSNVCIMITNQYLDTFVRSRVHVHLSKLHCTVQLQF